MKTLKINSTNGYLNLPDLPHNCIFNKVVTGCGGTTVVLFNDESYIIAVPTTELIVNKTGLTKSGLTTITSYDGKNSLYLDYSVLLLTKPKRTREICFQCWNKR